VKGAAIRGLFSYVGCLTVTLLTYAHTGRHGPADWRMGKDSSGARGLMPRHAHFSLHCPLSPALSEIAMTWVLSTGACSARYPPSPAGPTHVQSVRMTPSSRSHLGCCCCSPVAGCWIASVVGARDGTAALSAATATSASWEPDALAAHRNAVGDASVASTVHRASKGRQKCDNMAAACGDQRKHLAR
jgi:hypothetical protein